MSLQSSQSVSSSHGQAQTPNIVASQLPNQLAGQHSIWYESGRDFCFYSRAQQAVCHSQASLKKINLSAVEWNTLSQCTNLAGLAIVLSKITSVLTQQDQINTRRSNVSRKSEAFCLKFSDFVVRTEGIVKPLTNISQEFALTYGLLFVLFEAVVFNKEREEMLLEQLEILSRTLPVMEFYKTVFPTNAIKDAVVGLYVQVMKLLDESLIYFHSGRLSKLMDALQKPIQDKFESCISDIDTAVKRLEMLKDAAHVAQQSDMKQVLESTGRVIIQMEKNLGDYISAMGSSMGLLEMRLENAVSQITEIRTFEAIKYADCLCEVLLPEALEMEAEMQDASERQQKLSAKDHWEENGILDSLLDWSSSGKSSLLWIGGSSGNQDSWVTELTIDLMKANEASTSDVTVISVFCNSLETVTLGPVAVVKYMIVQVLQRHPEVVFQNPRLFNTRRFKRVQTFDQVWHLFEDLIIQVPNIMVLIDRIEVCREAEGADLTTDFLPSLLSAIVNMSVIVTSVRRPPESMLEDERVTHTYIDTGKRSFKRR